jgi:hypothetical protein
MRANLPLGLQILAMTPSITNSLAPAQGSLYGDPIYDHSAAIDNYIGDFL